MAAILVFQNNKTVAMLVFQTNLIPVGVQKPGSWNLFFNMQTLFTVPINLHLAWENSLDATTGFILILITCYYPDLGSSSNWSVLWREYVQLIERTTQIWVLIRHQYEISAVVSQTSLHRETRVASQNVGCFVRLICTEMLSTWGKTLYEKQQALVKGTSVPRENRTPSLSPVSVGFLHHS